jgi:23S rRNA pseudouridine1911/1915/1917 synthase
LSKKEVLKEGAGRPGVRLDVALIARHPGLSRRKAREAIEKGQVSVDGRMVREPGALLTAGPKITFDPNRKALSRVRATIPLLYEDETLLIVNKPAGLLSVPSGPGADHEETALRHVQDYVSRLNPKRPYVGLVHRIDRDTSGALVFAKSPESRQALIGLFSRHAIDRHYAALVQGSPAADAGLVDAPIRDAYEGGRRGVAKGDEPAQPARTRWRVVERLAGAALLDVVLETGRQHQVRIHLAHIGHPVLGDSRYGREPGKKAARPIPGARLRRQMLHAQSLAFLHPLTGTRVEVTSPLPEDFLASLETLRTAGRKTTARRAAPRRS